MLLLSYFILLNIYKKQFHANIQIYWPVISYFFATVSATFG